MGGGVVVDAVVGWSGVGWRQSVVWNPRRNEENEPRRSLWFVFMTHYAAPHTLGPPSHFSLPYSSLERQENRPHPFGKGRGGCGSSSLLR